MVDNPGPTAVPPPITPILNKIILLSTGKSICPYSQGRKQRVYGLEDGKST
ncbi:hypothetical protein L6252_03605 [Candidatus Parcubacteria bacterium]|nr:hypothetical protein [Candidatus Parcubacteria bacterium]